METYACSSIAEQLAGAWHCQRACHQECLEEQELDSQRVQRDTNKRIMLSCSALLVTTLVQVTVEVYASSIDLSEPQPSCSLIV